MAYKNKENRARLAREYRKRAKARISEQRKSAYARRTPEQHAYNASKARERYARVGWKDKGLPQPTRERPVVCECCGREPNAGKSLHLDHNHDTNRFRGWICHNCNAGIALLGDDADGVLRALAYLNRADLT